MTDLDKALGDISSIRKQVASSTKFYGYGPATLVGTALLAVAATCLQSLWLHDPASHTRAYVALWAGTAAVCVGLTAWQMYTRSQRMHSQLSDEMIRMAVEQFLPSLGAGLLLTLVLLRYVPQAVWMLPGMWQVIFSLGVFASCRFLPKPMVAVGIWYLLTGSGCIAVGDARALSPWSMGLPFGLGQCLVALVLLFGAQEAEHEI